jgi:hypothetical protein
MSKYITVDVDVSLDDFDDDDLVEHLRDAGYTVIGPEGGGGGSNVEALAVYEAMKMRLPNAENMAVDFILQLTGKVTI